MRGLAVTCYLLLEAKAVEALVVAVRGDERSPRLPQYRDAYSMGVGEVECC